MDLSRALCSGCGRHMAIRRVGCTDCGVTTEGDFEIAPLALLSESDQRFVHAFLRHHGSIKQMERVLGVSYPTVKNRLRAITEQLDEHFRAAPGAPESRRNPVTEATEQRQVLDMLSQDKIGLDDAERLLARLAEPGAEEGARETRRPPRGGPQLHVVSRSEDGDGIDIRIPLELLATGVELEKLLPDAAREAIEETGIEISELNDLRGETLVDSLRDLEVDVTTRDGASLSIRCE